MNDIWGQGIVYEGIEQSRFQKFCSGEFTTELEIASVILLLTMMN